MSCEAGEIMGYIKYFLIALLVILLDQASKLLVYHNMYLHQEINVIGEWFKLHYLLNPGMAFGIRWESEFGKLVLTIFRIVAMFGISWYLVTQVRRKAHSGFLLCLALILGGAIGNVIDSTFYGVFLNNAPVESPTRWFHGQVIDMLYFPLFNFYWPEWVPIKGGQYFEFFSPVFNIADSCIFIGVATIMIAQKRFFADQFEGDSNSLPSEEQPAAITSVESSEETEKPIEIPAQPREENKPDATAC